MDLSLASVLLAGFVVSIEPCALTVDLLIIGCIMGAEDDDKVSTGWIRGFLVGLAFIAGRSIAYAAMGGLCRINRHPCKQHGAGILRDGCRYHHGTCADSSRASHARV